MKAQKRALAAYESLLRSKVVLAPERGMEPGEMNPNLKPHAAAIAKWAIRGGSRAIFASFGLQKTSIQLQIVDSIVKGYKPPSGQTPCSLIICPLGVRREFIEEAKGSRLRLHPGLHPHQCRTRRNAGGRASALSHYLMRLNRFRNDDLASVGIDLCPAALPFDQESFLPFARTEKRPLSIGVVKSANLSNHC